MLLQGLLVAVSGPPTSLEYLPLHVAAAEGHFARAGVEITLRPMRSEADAAAALTRGEVDLAATSLEAALRFGAPRPSPGPRLVLGLTAAPPVAVLAARKAAGSPASMEDLAGRRVGVTTPGAPELAWFAALLRRAGIKIPDLQLVSLGTRPLAGAVESGAVQAGLVPEPHASRLLDEGSATLLADLRTPAAVESTMGRLTVNAAIFARADRLPPPPVLETFRRALQEAVRHLREVPEDALRGRLPPAVAGAPDDFSRRLQAARHAYLPDGVVGVAQARETIRLIRAYAPLPEAVTVPLPEELVRLPGP